MTKFITILQYTNIVINTYEQRAEILRALGHPVRLAMLKGLLGRECNVNKIVEALKIPQSTVSQHLRILKSAGIVKGKRKGVMICYRLADEFVVEILKKL